MIRTALIAALLVAFAALGADGAAPGDEPPLRDEDVVRAWVAGTSAAALIERIETSRTAFDVSDEMLRELRLAGLPGAVVEAMRTRQRELDAAAAPPPDEAEIAAAARPTFRIALRSPPADGDDDDGSAGALRMVNVLDTATAATLGVAPADRALDDIALFVACRTPDHVPDQWRGVSPLGRDFVSVPRHRMVVFLSGARAEAAPAAGLRRRLAQTLAVDADAATALGILRLDLPATIDLGLDPGVAHDLVIGLAVHTPDRWLAIALDQWDGMTAADGETLELEAAVSRTGAPVAAATKVAVVKPGGGGD